MVTEWNFKRAKTNAVNPSKYHANYKNYLAYLAALGVPIDNPIIPHFSAWRNAYFPVSFKHKADFSSRGHFNTLCR
jgi:hypothetical protein